MDLTSTPRIAQLGAEDLSALARILRSLGVALTGSENDAPAHASPHPECLLLARRLKACRSQRSQAFSADLFGEPAWDMMLALYLANGEGYRLKISALCSESGSPSTTALRWIDRLIDIGLARKVPNPLDARSTFIEATETLRQQMTAYLQGILERHLTPEGRRDKI